jgi:hypothetical protein
MPGATKSQSGFGAGDFQAHGLSAKIDFQSEMDETSARLKAPGARMNCAPGALSEFKMAGWSWGRFPLNRVLPESSHCAGW